MKLPEKWQKEVEQKGEYGLPWWRSGWESACQCRGHGFEPWSGKIPHAVEQLGPWATTTEPARLEPVFCNKRGRDSEWPVHRDEVWPPLAATREKPLHRRPTQPKINLKKKRVNTWFNKVLGKNEKCVLYFYLKTKGTFLANPIIR